MAGTDKRQHSVSLKIVIVTVYPELVGGADTFRLIGLALETTFCTIARLTLAALTLCIPALLLFTCTCQALTPISAVNQLFN